jgi:Flp pilus assembly protein TadG
MRRTRKARRGQAIVEFALVIPIFLLIFFGIIDAGRLIFTYNTVANAARNGARVAIVNQTDTGSNTCDTTSATAWSKGCAAVSAISLNLDPTDDTQIHVEYRNVTDTAPCASPFKIGCLAVVRVTGHFSALTPIIGQYIGQIDVSSTAKIPIERVCSNPPPAPLVQC